MLALAGCSAPAPKSPCEGLVYSDAGLTREQYAPCARAMVAKLDDVWAAVEIIFDKQLTKAERMRGREACLRASSELSRLMKQAGGADKLYRMAWADTALNRFNLDLENARTEYFLFCYYGAVGPAPTDIKSSHAEARRFVAALR